MLNREFVRLVKVLFRNYYRSVDLGMLSNLEFREFGFQFFDREGMVRHMAFKNIDDLKQYLIINVPAHVYYSTALYRDPANQNMDEKGWQGADLVFDIDGDHLETESCKSTELMTLECLEDATEEANKLLDVLFEDFGFEESSVKIYFSGHRGYHVHIEEEGVRKLSDNERREVVDYLLMRGFSLKHLIKPNVILIDPKLRGIGGRVSGVIHDIDNELLEKLSSSRRRSRGLLGKLNALSNEVSRRLAVHVDEVVTMDTHRLIRMPNSLHGKTGLRVTPLSPGDLERGADYVIDRVSPFRKGSLTIRLLKKLPVRRVMGVDIVGEEGSIIKVPVNIGIYLVTTGWGDLVD